VLWKFVALEFRFSIAFFRTFLQLVLHYGYTLRYCHARTFNTRADSCQHMTGKPTLQVRESDNVSSEACVSDE